MEKDPKDWFENYFTEDDQPPPPWFVFGMIAGVLLVGLIGWLIL